MSTFPGCGSCRPLFAINRTLLPIKIHYFLYFGGLAGILPFLPIFAKQLGISATIVGLIYTFLPLLSVAAKPVCGSIADWLQKTKVFLLIMLLLVVACHMPMLLLPKESAHSDKSGTFGDKSLTCSGLELNFTSTQCAKICNGTDSLMTCCHHNISSGQFNTSEICTEIISMYNKSFLKDLEHPISFEEVEYTLHCNGTVNHCQQNPNLKDEAASMYTPSTFIIYLCLLIGGYISIEVGISLSDTVCYEMMSEGCQPYGWQRIWGTIGWGAVAILAGYLNDVASEGNEERNYFPGFCILGILLGLDILCVMRLQVKNTKSSEPIFKQVALIFKEKHVIIFLFAVFLVGILTGLQWSYTFWYLEDLGATQLLMGLVLAIQCFLGELPFMYFSDWIIYKIGHYATLSLALAAFGLRYIGYYFLRDPWWVLPIELLQGLSFGTFYSCLTSFAKISASSGTEATMQGLFGATFTGLGVAVGNLTGGLSFDAFGSRYTFLYFGGFSFAASLVMAGIPAFCQEKR